jgi:hypothetical protein
LVLNQWRMSRAWLNPGSDDNGDAMFNDDIELGDVT